MDPKEPKGEQKPKESIHLWVNGLVAARNQEPYVQIMGDKGIIVQFTVAEARSFAFDLVEASHNAEADAMVVRFFGKLELPAGALAAFMQEFRQFRYLNEQGKVETSRSDPDTGEIYEGPPPR
jgi:hypothetical protein